MATLLFQGESLKVKVTHNVISEYIKLNNTTFTEVIGLSKIDPMGWTRDILYCSLRVYNPAILGAMTKWDVGDILFENSGEAITAFMTELLEDFVLTVSGKDVDLKKVASEKK